MSRLDGVDLGAVCERIGELTDSGEPAKALALVEKLRAGGDTTATACEQQRVDALAASAAEARTTTASAHAGPTVAEQASRSWSAFYENQVAPTATAGVPFLVVLLLLGVLARLALPLSWGRLTRNREQRATDVRHGVAWALGGAVLATLVLPHVPPVPRPAVLFFALAACVVAVLLLSQAWAEALRVRVEVVKRRDVDRAASGHLAGLLAGLAADRPRGVELPIGMDVEALSGAPVSVPPTGAVALVLYRVGQVLVPTHPWRVRVDTAGEDVMTVTVKRFRRRVTTVVVDRDALGLRLRPATPTDDLRVPDLYRVAAATVVAAVADERAHSEDGLSTCGASDWRSIGLQAVATYELARSPERMVPLLARAVDLDPDNAAAHVALWYARYRHATDAPSLDAYIAWLTEAIDLVRGRDTGWTCLRLRLRHSLAAVTLNRMSVDGPDMSAALQGDARAATAELVHELEEHRGTSVDRGPAPLARDMWHAAAAMYLSAHQPGDPFWAAASGAFSDEGMLAPTARYAYACHLAGPAAPGIDEHREARDRRAVDQLRFADELPELAWWRERDPALRALRSRPAYQERYGDGHSPGLFRTEQGTPAEYVSIRTTTGEPTRSGRTK